jgi:hypothetical protein
VDQLSDPPMPEVPIGGGANGTTGEHAPLLPEFHRGTLPRWALVRQHLDTAEIDDVEAAVRAALEPEMHAIRPGSRVCLAVGSRGIDRIDLVVRATVRRLTDAGARVFIVPSMGSHGGATAEGQVAVLAELGVTAETAGCEIRSSMDTVELGEVRPGVPLFVDRNALEGADAIIPINRVKVHSDFSGPIESGLMKMMVIGLGKQKGADTLHAQGFAAFHELIPESARFIMARVPIPFGLALVENGQARLHHVEAVAAERIPIREPELLVMATAAMGRIPLTRIDVLIVDQLGKDISGLGMDSNVIGRYYDGPTGNPPLVQRIIVRDLTEATRGNAVGIGLAEVALRRAIEKIDVRKTYMNVITAKTPEGARIPITTDTDRDALAIALGCCLKVVPERARIVRIRDTKRVEDLYVTEPALEEMMASGRCEILEPLHPIGFDGAGMFADELP